MTTHICGPLPHELPSTITETDIVVRFHRHPKPGERTDLLFYGYQEPLLELPEPRPKAVLVEDALEGSQLTYRTLGEADIPAIPYFFFMGARSGVKLTSVFECQGKRMVFPYLPLTGVLAIFWALRLDQDVHVHGMDLYAGQDQVNMHHLPPQREDVKGLIEQGKIKADERLKSALGLL